MTETEEGDRLPSAPHPRQTRRLAGHSGIEQTVLAAWNRNRLPHAILLGGPEGIGKATLAYRIARFVLAHPEPMGELPPSLDLPPEHSVFRQVRALSHPDLFVLRRAVSEGGKLPMVIPVEDVRRAVLFFGSTPALGGYRVAIVDSADELNPSGANALLKLLEEPPTRSLLLIVSHAPGRLLPTIRSRCRRFTLRPLATEDVVHALEHLADEIADLPRESIPEAASASGGSVRHALELLLGDSLEVRKMTTELLAQLPAFSGEALHALSDRLQRGDALSVFAETVEDWVASRATGEAALPRLARFAESWEKVRRAAIETDVYNLDRRPLVFQVFAMLAEATRH